MCHCVEASSHSQCLSQPLSTLFSKTAQPTETGAQRLARLASQKSPGTLGTRTVRVLCSGLPAQDPELSYRSILFGYCSATNQSL